LKTLGEASFSSSSFHFFFSLLESDHLRRWCRSSHPAPELRSGVATKEKLIMKRARTVAPPHSSDRARERDVVPLSPACASLAIRSLHSAGTCAVDAMLTHTHNMTPKMATSSTSERLIPVTWVRVQRVRQPRQHPARALRPRLQLSTSSSRAWCRQICSHWRRYMDGTTRAPVPSSRLVLYRARTLCPWARMPDYNPSTYRK